MKRSPLGLILLLLAALCACGSDGGDGGGSDTGPLPEERFFRIPAAAVERLDYTDGVTVFELSGFAACAAAAPDPAAPCPELRVAGLAVYSVDDQFYVVGE